MCERISCDEAESAEICNRIVQLRKENIHHEVVQESGQGAHGNIRVNRNYILESLDERKRRWKEKAHVENTRFDEDLMPCS